MGILRDYQRAALAFIAISVVALYGAAFAFPFEPRHEATVEWIALPDVASAAEEPKLVVRETVAVSDETPKLPGSITVAELHDKFGLVSFDLNAVREGEQPVPRIFVNELPHDFKAVGDVGKLKQTFFKLVLPLALKVNEEILADRHKLLLLKKQKKAGQVLSSEQQAWLEKLAARYDTSPDDLPELLRRVDVVSPALALAQSAEESGWGRSRFALAGNALFGQRTWTEGRGIVPRQRDEDGRFEVRKFPSLLESVRSYARNLNGHPAYDAFRERRAQMRAHGDELDPYGLIETLTSYSERREEYVETIQKILRVDNLEELEDTELEERPVETSQLPAEFSQR